MIGAVVGVQPFGGRGLPGTGPKAGGPLYLHRLVRSAAEIAPHLGVFAELPGPVGARNLYGLHSRGRVLLMRSEEHTSDIQLLMRTSSDVFCLKKKTKRPN